MKKLTNFYKNTPCATTFLPKNGQKRPFFPFAGTPKIPNGYSAGALFSRLALVISALISPFLHPLCRDTFCVSNTKMINFMIINDHKMIIFWSLVIKSVPVKGVKKWVLFGGNNKSKAAKKCTRAVAVGFFRCPCKALFGCFWSKFAQKSSGAGCVFVFFSSFYEMYGKNNKNQKAWSHLAMVVSLSRF